MSRTTAHQNRDNLKFVIREDPEFEGVLEEARQGLRLHRSEIDTALLVFGRVLDAALAVVQEAEKQPDR